MDEVERLIRELTFGDSNVRNSAIEQLEKIGASAVPALIEALGVNSTERRTIVSEVLKNIKDAVPILIKVLKDKKTESDIRCEVADVLGKIKDVKSVPALIETLEDWKWGVQVHAITALGEIGDSSAVPALNGMLKCKENRQDLYSTIRLRSEAAIALKMIKDRSVVPALIEALKYEPLLAESRIQDRLVIMGWVREARTEIAQAIVDIVKPDVITLIETLKEENDDVRKNIIHALSKAIENSISIKELEEFERNLKEGFSVFRKGREISRTDMKYLRLMIEIANKKNSLAPQRDIILDDIPKPPKKGGVYQQIRRKAQNV